MPQILLGGSSNGMALPTFDWAKQDKQIMVDKEQMQLEEEEQRQAAEEQMQQEQQQAKAVAPQKVPIGR
ncbi:hypothetical protein FRB94_004643 [Tulasnella sp. JGI-2019a]|nr:hypothetical protein FRB93_003975 [Tulasnella sp. JGI-2019a]KAG9001657.1 hypothetical protein FRB94_004643 [Tulasnella sp. JGI-2019a]